MKYEYWFANIKELTNKKKKDIRARFVCAEEIYNMKEAKLKNIGIEETDRRNISKSKEKWDLEAEYHKLKEKQIRFFTVQDASYPERLREISSSPYVLYVKGELPREDKLSVAIVGARECSSYGEAMARSFASELSKVGAQIISGMARGVDGASQSGALDVNGESFGVLGCGVDICYPRDNIELYMKLQEKGGILSEQPLGTQPLPQFFPARNRIISGLADVVLVIEAKEKSGSLITADLALEQGKDVYALPGPINSVLSKGCNQLIKQGAGILISPKDLLQDLGIFNREETKKTIENKILLETPENIVYSCLCLDARNLSELSEMTGMKIPELMDVLINLQLQGYIKEISKNYYVKII